MDPPFNMTIVGVTACGKTQYLLEMVQTEYLGVFDYVILNILLEQNQHGVAAQ